MKELAEEDKKTTDCMRLELDKVRRDAGFGRFMLISKALSKVEACRVVFQSAKDEEVTTLIGEMKCRYKSKQYKLEINITIMKKQMAYAE